MEAQRQHPRERHREKGLQKFGRLEPEHPASEPALRTVDRGADERHEKEQEEKGDGAVNGEAPRLRLGQHRDHEHHGHADDYPHQLAIEIIERVERRGRSREFLRRDRRCRRDRDEPDRDEDRDEQQQHAVDFPEPEAERRAVGAAEARAPAFGRARRGDHRAFGRIHIVPPAHAPSARTAARNASPRCS